jgi:uncharacterized phage protein (TIGR02218 family)
MPEIRVDQGGVYALVGVTPQSRAAQAGAYALANVAPPVRAAQAGAYALVAITARAGIAQGGVYALAGGGDCATKRAQIWTIRRTDGVTFRFTSLDRDLVLGGVTYKACGSLDPSASENVAEVDDAGSMDLSGAITRDGDPDLIEAWDLSAGRFDGATAEAWLVPWDGRPGRMRRLLKGNWGNVQQTQTGFKVDMVGDGDRLKQTPLVFLLQPPCRWRFGDPVTCGKDLGPLTVTGTVALGATQREFSDGARTEPAGYFKFGRVTFLSGLNADISAEIKEHVAGGAFELWPRLPFPPDGAAYSMTPGCTNLKAADGGCNGCTAWGQLLRYGGFDKVPGRDKRNAAADVKTG